MQNAASRFLLAFFGLLLFLGNPQWSQADTATGRQQLFNNGNMTVSGLLAARDTFADAVDADPTDQEAQAFYGVTHALAFIFEDGTTAEIDNLKELFEAFGVTRTGNEGIDMELFSGLPTFDDRYDPPAALPDGEAIRAFVQGPLLNRLGEVLDALNTVGTGFAVSVTAAETGDEPLNIDYADIRVLRAWVNAARTFALIVSAYDLSCDLNDIVQLINMDMLQLQRDLLDANDNLLTLQPDGADSLEDASQALQVAISEYGAAHDAIVASIDGGDWRSYNLFTFDSLAEANTSGFFLTRMDEIQAALNEDRPASLISIEQTWILTTDGPGGNPIAIQIEKDQQNNIEEGEWHGINGCIDIGCGGAVQDVDIEGAVITFVLSGDYCDSEATFTGTLSGNSITSGTYSGINCYGPISGGFTGSMDTEETLTDVIDVNRIFGTGSADPLNIRAVLPDFHAYNEPIIGTFPPIDGSSPSSPSNPIFNGILPFEPQIVTNDDATRQFDLMPSGSFSIPPIPIVIDGDFTDWPETARVFDDISQDDPEKSYNGNEDLKSFWMAQDDTYYYMRAVYHDGPALEGANTEIIFNAGEVPGQVPIYYKQFNVLPYSAEGGSIYIFAGSFQHYSGSSYVRSGFDGDDACVEWRIPKEDLGDLSGRFIDLDTALNHNDGSNTYRDINPTFVQFTGYTISGTVAIDGYTDGKVLLLLYNGEDPDNSQLLASTVIDGPGAFTLEDLASMEDTTCYLYALWDRDGNGIVSFDDMFGVASFPINVDVENLSLSVDQTIDFYVDGSVMNVHQPDGTYATYLDLYISGFNTGILPDDIDDVVFRGPGGTILATLDSPNVSVDAYDNDEGEVFIVLPGQPQLGTYTFTVTSGNAVRTATDTQTVIREIPLPDVNSFFPQPGAGIDFATPILSWDPVFYAGIPLYYRLQIQDAWGNLVVNTPRTLNMTSYAVPPGTLRSGESYIWRVRVTDSGNWVAVENRSHSAWQPFTAQYILDSDYDGLPDDIEIPGCTEEDDPDSDGDGLLDGIEDANRNGSQDAGETDPCNWDSDADGMADGWEVDNGLAPLVNDAFDDGDGDGYSNLREFLSGSSPWDDQDLPAILADFATENVVDGSALYILIDEFDRADCSVGDPCSCDLNADGMVDEIDLYLFSEDYGRAE